MGEGRLCEAYQVELGIFGPTHFIPPPFYYAVAPPPVDPLCFNRKTSLNP